MARGSTSARLALALLIGAAAGPWFNLTHPTALDALLNALAIALPPLLAVLLAKARPNGALLRVGLAVALLVIILPLGDVLLNAIQGRPQLDTLFVVGMAVVLCPLVAVFAVGTRGARLGGTVGLALGCGALAWVGMGLHNLLVPLLLGAYSRTGPSGDFGDLVFATLLIFYLIGFALALLLGVLGAAIRLWLARPAE
ncbi:MAG TPA: hypothetical protein VFQ32_04650 [Ktedonobacterales bacterium]|nr:hypothetical protein [Ktedonobacterales bacterium]